MVLFDNIVGQLFCNKEFSFQCLSSKIPLVENPCQASIGAEPIIDVFIAEGSEY